MLIRSKLDLLSLIKALDQRMNEPLVIHIIGGANLVATGATNRPTLDIDVVSPVAFPPQMLKAIQEIAAEKGISPQWINTMPSMDLRFLAKRWEERSTEFYRGKNLTVMCLARKDILGMKIAAAFDRKAKKDVEDILVLNPTHEEWEFAHQWARNYDANPEWPKWIDELVRELREKQLG